MSALRKSSPLAWARVSARAFLTLAVLAGAGAFAPAPCSAGPPATRLGRDVVPTFEAVELTLDPRRKEYSGVAHVDLDVKTATRTIRFHARDMLLVKTVLRSERDQVPLAIEAGERGIRLARSPRELPPGKYTLDVEFTNEFGGRAAGLYRVDKGGESYAFTQFEADDARGAFPCWDEPEFKIPYQITLKVPAAHLAVSNTPAESELAQGEWKTVVFRRTRPLPSYLIAFASGPFETVPIPGLSIPGRVVTVKGTASQTGLAVSMTPPILRALERYFGGGYPYEKLDLIAVPEFWPGAMENPGAITFADGVLLLDDRRASLAERSRLAKYLAHELSHMWFGDLVTMRWWDDLWLNESFAEWMGDKIAQEVYPEYHLNIDQGTEVQTAFHEDARLASHALRQPVEAVDNLLQLVDALTYQKGEAVLGMFEVWLGPETFRNGVLDYIATHRSGSAEAADLWEALSKASGKDVRGAMGTFIEQAGVPLVSAEILPDGRVRLSQRRFLNYGNAAPDGRLWKIPVAMKYSDGSAIRVERVLLRDSSMVVSLPGGRAPAWLHPNAGEIGYYRWQVSPEQLETLSRSPAAIMDPRERVGFLANASGLLDAGAIHADEYLKLLGRFVDDPSPDAVDAAVNALEEVRLAFITPELAEPFARYVRATFRPALERYGTVRAEGEDPAISRLRPDLLLWLGDAGQDARALDFADSLARRYMADASSVDPSLVTAALDLHATRADRARFDELRRRFESARAPAERRRYLDALGYVRDPKLVDAALDYALHGPLQSQEVIRIPSLVGRSPAFRHVPFHWLTANYDTVMAKIPQMYAILVMYFAEGCSDAILEEAKAFYAAPGRLPPGMDRELAKVADDTKDCVGLRAREQTRLAAYLDQLPDAR
jgi:aminopeptidase N